MPAQLGSPAGTSSEAEKSAALEAVGARHGLTYEQVQALTAVGVTGAGHPQHIQRPWGSDDDAMVRRLARVRGWSPAAISVFLNRPEAQVRASLTGHAPGRTQGSP